ncbi:MAG: ATPase [Tissierellia bacterium]|nr:ATPase [Tissierellia bacterium]
MIPSKLEGLLQRKEQFSATLQREIGKRQVLEDELERISGEIQNLEAEEKLLEEVVILLQKTAEYARDQAANQVEELVTRCLAYILENDARFSVEFSESRGLPIAEFFVISDYGDATVKTKPERSRGGGVVDVVSFALRMAFLEIHRPALKGPLFLDEPGKHVSEDYIFNFGEFIKECAQLFDRQIIMVTHNDHLSQMSDRAFRVQIRGGISSVEELEGEV